MSELEIKEDKRVTIKILRSLHDKAQTVVEKTGDYSTDSDFFNDAIREKLERVHQKWH